MQDNKKKRKAQPGGNIKWINLPRNWVHQAFSYMDKGEMIFRILVVIIELLAVSFLVNYFLSDLTTSVVISFIFVHTWNWVTNCLFWSVIMFTFPEMKNPGDVITSDYLNRMKCRLQSSNAVSGLALFGSVSRNKWHNKSDIDLRIIRRHGVANWFISNLIMMRERFIALIKKQPMDMFLADGVRFLDKMRNDEPPVFLIKRDVRLDERYPGINQIDRIESLKARE